MSESTFIDPTKKHQLHNSNNNNNNNNNNNHNHNKPLSDDWRAWLRLNVARGCSRSVLYNRCVHVEGFSSVEVQAALGYELEHQQYHPQNNQDDNNKFNNTTAATTTTTTTTKKRTANRLPLTNAWKETLRVKMDQGVDKEELFLYCIKEGLDLDDIAHALGGYRARSLATCNHNNHNYNNNKFRPAFTKRTFVPRAWRLDTELVELYEIPNFLTREECQLVIQAIDDAGVLERSPVVDTANITASNGEVRTSQTCHLRIDTEAGIVFQVEHKLRALMGPDHDPTCAEILQGQVYGEGNYFQAHTDWFDPNNQNDEDYNNYHSSGGQRTWTVMIYLNSVSKGGGTKFHHLDREFTPQPGLALAWNNLDADGITPNPWTLHEAMPIIQGKKYVLTKWYRERPMVL